MSATAAEPAGAAFPAAQQALPVDTLPPAVQKLLGSATPMKVMAAKGIAPLRPGELLIAIYQLSFDPDTAVHTAAETGLSALPDKIVAPALGEALPPAVIHLFAARLAPTRTEALEKVLYNQATADQTFVRLASHLHERELEVIFQNEARLLRCPAILEALYNNPQARMSSVNRAIELLVRNNVRAEGIPSFDDVAKAIAGDPTATAPTADAGFAQALAASEGQAPEEEAQAADPVQAAKPKAEGDNKARKGPIIDFTKLKLYEKIRLATLGNEYCRQNLMRDPNRMVAMAAIRSPRITDAEIVKTASNRSVSEDVIRYIAGQRDLTKSYQVKLNLVQNPKCPVALSLRFLPLLNADDLKHVARSKNVPSALSTGARRLMQTRGKD